MTPGTTNYESKVANLDQSLENGETHPIAELSRYLAAARCYLCSVAKAVGTHTNPE